MKVYYFLLIIFIANKGLANAPADSLMNLFFTSQNNTEKVELAMRLSREISRNSSATGSQDEFYYANLAIEIAETINDDLLLAKSFDNLGLLYRFNQKYGQSVLLHKRAFDLVDVESGNTHYKMRFANNVGVAARYDQNHALAVKYYLKALGIARGKNDLRNIAISSNGLGNSLSYLDPGSQQAMNHFREALEAERERGNQRGIAMNLLSIGSYHTRMGNYQQAFSILNQLLEINQQINDKHGLAITYEFFGHNYLEEGLQLDEAIRYYRLAFQLFEELGNHQKMAGLQLHLGQAAEMRGQPSLARNHYTKSLSIAQDGEYKALIASAAERISALFENTGEFRRALRYYKLAKAYNDSIDLIRQQSIIQGLQMQYDFEQKENEIRLLKANQEISQAELFAQTERHKRERMFFTVAILIVLSITSVIILSLRNISLKKSIRLQEEAQRRARMEQEYQRDLWQAEILATRMQMNPHFLFNCLNSVKFMIQKHQEREAIKYITTLSKFIRELLQTGKLQSISLQQELELAKKYIHLEAIRFDQQLEYNIRFHHIDQSLLDDIAVPPMVLQPFIENAIWHGLVPSLSSHKKLSIDLYYRQTELVIRIEDNGVGRQYKKEVTGTTHKSMGLQITQDRIALFNKLTSTQLQVNTEDLFNDQQKPSGTRVNLNLSMKNLQLN